MTTTFSDDGALPGAADGAPEVPGVGSLVEVINDEIRVFHELLDTLQQEQKAIVADDLPRIEELAALKADGVARAQRLEGERLRHVRALSEALEVDPERTDLQRLIETIDGRHAEELTRMRQVLLDLNRKIRRTNDNNAFLIRQSLRYTERCIDILTGDPGDRGVYGKFGKNMKRARGNSVLNRTV